MQPSSSALLVSSSVQQGDCFAQSPFVTAKSPARRFKDPRFYGGRDPSERFVWDYWHVPRQVPKAAHHPDPDPSPSPTPALILTLRIRTSVGCAEGHACLLGHAAREQQSYNDTAPSLMPCACCAVVSCLPCPNTGVERGDPPDRTLTSCAKDMQHADDRRLCAATSIRSCGPRRSCSLHFLMPQHRFEQGEPPIKAWHREHA